MRSSKIFLDAKAEASTWPWFALAVSFLPRSFLGRLLAAVVTLALLWIFIILSGPRTSDPYAEAMSRGIARHAAELPVQTPDDVTGSTQKHGEHNRFVKAAKRDARQMQTVEVPKSADVVRKGETIWSIEQGPLAFQIDVGNAKHSMGTADTLFNAGKDCWGPCREPGLCTWCGSGNACCRRGSAEDPPICKTATAFATKHHECVIVSNIAYPDARLSLLLNGETILGSPLRAMWSVGRQLQNGWPTKWDHGKFERIDVQGPWLMVEGSVHTPDGQWVVKDQWRLYDGVVEGFRDWLWLGKESVSSKDSVLSIAWEAIGGHGTGLLMPAAVYHGNPSGLQALKSGFALVPTWTGDGSRVQIEEHRLAQTWESFEWLTADDTRVVVALDSQPSAPPYGNHADLAWTLGAEGHEYGTTLQILSGPVALNGKTGVMKTGQNSETPFLDAGLSVPSGHRIQKRYRLHAKGHVQEGAGFRVPLDWSLTRGDLSADSLPRFPDIVEAKVRFALSRWAGENKYPGFAMYPGIMETYTMGWAGQAEAPGYALQVLAQRLGKPELRKIACRALDVLSQATFNDNGFMLQLNGQTGQWTSQDPVSQGQAMSAFARAISYGRGSGADVSRWEQFLERACKNHAARILHEDWYPRSTAEAFIIQPLALGAKLFNNDQFLKAALKAGDHYLKRHVGLKEPFWGGTLDAQCEDKEGAWAGFEAFLALYESTRDAKWLAAANYAADMTLTYTYLWDVNLPPGRLRDHDLKTRGWTAVSVQNMHLDVYGVLYTPRLWRLGELANRPELFHLAELMYRACGQMIDAYGSQGEQLQQTRFAQAGDLSDPEQFRGGYVESWTVFWIAAHFLTAAAQFEEMGVLSDLWTRV